MTEGIEKREKWPANKERNITGGDEGWRVGRERYDGEKEGDGARLLLSARVIFIE